jgi:hypothetical protein
MEVSTAMIVAIAVIAGGGATGAVMIAEGDLDLTGNDDTVGINQVEALPYEEGDGTCSLGRDAGDCAMASAGCSVPGGDASGSGGCCG